MSGPQQNLPVFIKTTNQAADAISEICKYQYVGLDTEFYGCDITKESPVGRSVCHVFSVATPSGPLLPRGFHEATSYVFAGELLSYGPVARWLSDPGRTKCVHNQPVDAHTIRNAGVVLRGAQNTLAMARFWWPHRAKFEGFDLDSLGKDYCGAGKTESFDGLLGYNATEEYPVEVERRVCHCGATGCRKRKGDHFPVGTVLETALRHRKVRRHLELTELHPGHELWARYLAYAAWDAVLALWIYEVMLREGEKERPFPWKISL